MSRGAPRLAARAAALGLGFVLGASGCARIHTSTVVESVPREGGELVRLPGAVHVVGRRHGARWVQLGDELVVELSEHRRCRERLHRPVVRVETVHRKSDHTLVLEWILAAGVSAFAAYAFLRPDSFGQPVYTQEGESYVDPAPGYRVGGIFAGVGALLIGSSIYDTTRTRDTVHYADAYAVVGGPAVICPTPVAPYAHRDVTLKVGDFESSGRTDARGRVRLTLPPATEDAGASKVLPASIRIDETHAVGVDFRVPYGSTELRPARTGEAKPASAEAPPPREGPR